MSMAEIEALPPNTCLALHNCKPTGSPLNRRVDGRLVCQHCGEVSKAPRYPKRTAMHKRDNRRKATA
jgi:uncharacterized Zn finger protein (UPF0148 family)